MNDRVPQVFISYSWTSEEYKEQIEDMAKQLMHDGIRVKLDVWDLKEGQDKYQYMEQCVTDEAIDKVLIFSDKKYAEKADKRSGGVGDETLIISPKVYADGQQEKFIPILMERNERGEPYLPSYLQSRKYIDFTSSDYEETYEELVRIIYELPKKRKPELGEMPKWLVEDESLGASKVRRNIRLKEKDGSSFTMDDFLSQYIELLKPFRREEYSSKEEFLSDFKETLECRNIFLDYVKAASSEENFGLCIAAAFEKLYNAVFNAEEFYGNSAATFEQYDLFQLHIWELFICVTAYMLRNELYVDLRKMLVRTYFLRVSPVGSEITPVGYEHFLFRSRIMEEWVKPTMDGELSRKYTLAGHFLIEEREYRPIYTKKAIANADLFLYQVYKGLPLGNLAQGHIWFPICYVYERESWQFWERLKSRAYCEKLYILFEVGSIGGLKERLENCTSDPTVRYGGGFAMPAPAILERLKLEEIGTLP